MSKEWEFSFIVEIVPSAEKIKICSHDFPLLNTICFQLINFTVQRKNIIRTSGCVHSLTCLSTHQHIHVHDVSAVNTICIENRKIRCKLSKPTIYQMFPRVINACVLSISGAEITYPFRSILCNTTLNMIAYYFLG